MVEKREFPFEHHGQNAARVLQKRKIKKEKCTCFEFHGTHEDKFPHRLLAVRKPLRCQICFVTTTVSKRNYFLLCGFDLGMPI